MKNQSLDKVCRVENKGPPIKNSKDKAGYSGLEVPGLVTWPAVPGTLRAEEGESQFKI